MTWYSWIRW